MAEDVASLVRQHWEGAAALWQLRDHACHSPDIRLTDLVRLDERLEAYVDAARVIAGQADDVAAELVAEGLAGTVFTAAVVAIERDPARMLDLLSPEDAWDAARPIVSAIAWTQREPARRAIDLLLQSSVPACRAVAAAASGARRLDMGDALASAMADRSPGVRAHAYRTAGQLGRVNLRARLIAGRDEEDSHCRFWSAWAAARLGATEALEALTDIAWNNHDHAERALDLLLRRLDVPQANGWLRGFARLRERHRDLIRATGVIGDPLYIAWLIERMAEPATARLAGESFSMITGLDLSQASLERRAPDDAQSGPNDDPADEDVAVDPDERLPWPDPVGIGHWWGANRERFTQGTAYFLGVPKTSAAWLRALFEARQGQRHAAALELAIRQPDKSMFEVRARGRMQRQILARSRPLS